MRYYMPWHRRSNNTGKIVLGAIAGVVTGLAAGFLTAPRTGKETRQLISSRTNETLHKVGKGITETKDKVLKKGKEKTAEVTSGS